VSRRRLYYEVPADTPVKICDGCPARIYWITTPKGKRMPIDVYAGEGCEVPTPERPGRGVPHWATCPAADRFRKRPTKPGAA